MVGLASIPTPSNPPCLCPQSLQGSYKPVLVKLLLSSIKLPYPAPSKLPHFDIFDKISSRRAEKNIFIEFWLVHVFSSKIWGYWLVYM